jgi:8-oxo-dGTP pyrophosphatase MutT (NUDIX family)
VSDSTPRSVRPASADLPRRPHGSGDAWVSAADGTRYWGTYGAAGLLVVQRETGVLLQHRAEWSHFGGTWGLPGGARHEGESARDAALREANEEAGVPAHELRPLFESVLDLGWWSYTTVVARADVPFTPVIGDAESIELRWVAVDDVENLPLHPRFGERWPALRRALDAAPRLVVDAANVVGSRPDGWWRDRAAATERLLVRLAALASVGVPADLLGREHDTWWPQIDLIVEGQARQVRDDALVQVVRASADGDSAIVADVAAGRPEETTVVTADRELRGSVETLGARTISPSALTHLLEQ